MAMKEFTNRGSSPRRWTTLVFLLALAASLASGQEKAPAAAPPAASSDYVGAETCKACHDPGAAHVAGGGDVTKIFTFKNASAKDISQRCLKCHQYGQEHANFSRSAHLQNNVSCVDCHSPHHPKERAFLMREKQPQLCYGCHIEIKQQFGRTFHHRVNEGLLNCTDCHNPHGGTLGRQLRASAAQDTVCFKCHADKAGPFVYEHQVVKIEGCVS